MEVNYFMQFFGIEYPTDEITQELTELYKEIYSHSKYEVGEAADVSENTYGVPLTIYPIDIMQKAVSYTHLQQDCEGFLLAWWQGVHPRAQRRGKHAARRHPRL